MTRVVLGVVLAAMAALAFSSIQHKSRTYDEGHHLAFGRKVLAGDADRAYMQRMPITAVNALPIVALERFGVSLSAGQELLVGRLPTIGLLAVLAGLVFVWSRRLHGPGGGTLSLLLVAMCPNLLAHGRLATNDVACALFFAASCWACVRLAHSPSWQRLVVLSLLVGVAQVTKQTALLLFPLLVVYLAVIRLVVVPRDEALATRWRVVSLPRAAGGAALMASIVVLTINAAYAFHGSFRPTGAYAAYVQRVEAAPDVDLFQAADLGGGLEDAGGWPVPLPRSYVEVFLLGQHLNAHARGHGSVYLLGQRRADGFWWYVPVVLGLKMTLPALAMIGARLLAIRRRLRAQPVDEWMLWLAPASILLFFTFSTAQLGVRYLLPAFPFFFVAAGALWPASRARRWRAALVAGVLWHGASMLSFHPHHLSYVNELILDRSRIYEVLADSNVDWGQNRYYLEEYLRAHEGERIWVNPGGPVRGQVIVDINRLVGVSLSPSVYRWLRDGHRPVGHIAYSWLIYDTRE